MNHPLKVYYPFGGIHYIVEYNTYNERDKIVLARSKQSAEKTIKSVLEHERDGKVINFQKVEILAPSNKMCELAIKADQKQKEFTFYISVVCNLKYAQENGSDLPDIFKVCDNYVCSYDEEKFEKDDIEHWSCDNCKEKIALKEFSQKEFYNKYSKIWYENFPITEYVNEKQAYSKAETAKDEDVVHYYTNSGYGINNDLFNENSTDVHTDGSSVLFFYKLIEDLDCENLKDFANELEKQRMIDIERREELRMAEVKTERLGDMIKTLEILKAMSYKSGKELSADRRDESITHG